MYSEMKGNKLNKTVQKDNRIMTLQYEDNTDEVMLMRRVQKNKHRHGSRKQKCLCSL